MAPASTLSFSTRRRRMPEGTQPHEPSRRSVPQGSAAESSNRAQHSNSQTQGPVLHNCRIGNFYNIIGSGSSCPPLQPPAPLIPDDIRDGEEHRVPSSIWTGRAHPSRRPPPAHPSIRDYFDRRHRARLPPPMWLVDTLRRLRLRRYRDPHLGYPIIPVTRNPSPHEPRPMRAARAQIPRPSVVAGIPRRAVYPETESMIASPSDSDSDTFASSSSSGSSNGGEEQAAEGRRLREAMRRLSIDSYEARRERDRASRNATRRRRFRDRWDSDSSTEIEGMVQACQLRCADGCVNNITGGAAGEVPHSSRQGVELESHTVAGEDETGRIGLRRVVVVDDGELSGEPSGGVRLLQGDGESIATCSSNLGSGETTSVPVTPTVGSERSER